MSNQEKNREEDSDSSDDEDYVPEAEDRNLLSEEDSDGAVDEDALDSDNEEGAGRKRKLKGASKGKSRKKARHVPEQEDPEKASEAKKLNEEQAKKKADDIWAAFKMDTNFVSAKPAAATVSKSETETPVTTNGASSSSSSSKKVEEVEKPSCDKKKEEPKIFEFAGETLVMTGENNLKPTEPAPKPVPMGIRRTGGLGGLMSQLKSKGTKLSTLEKSKMDWQNFKSKEGLDEEITTHNRGKQGYLERQDFLERADHRQFEIEKQMRATNRKSNR